MAKDETVKASKFLSLVLRHEPGLVGISLDSAGWVSVEELLRGCRAHGRGMSLEELRAVVERNDKRRFSFSEDGSRIRASQGHSVPVELGYESAEPPEVLYHGTVERFLPSIMEEGLRRRGRHHVHLSADVETASKVGGRRGRPVILKVESGRMRRDGHEFFLSANGVWLTERVPPEYLSTPGSLSKD
ncbi:MAG TPA: RNA 2'-phosphotransferase [Pyrinomonadaceae bacterium]|jgi:putative RNA 2'-phosphotransferase|nr:RNA 2'-phosphotransferase [Pyrinomonadaceae bacterium]